MKEQHKVFVLRHADMFRKEPRELNPHGIEQAHSMGKALAELGHRHLILSSPYVRTMQTAGIIAEYVNVISVESLDILREYEKEEPLDDMRERAEIALQIACALFRLNPIIVSHREPIRAMMAGVFNKDLRKIAVPKAGGFVLNFDGSSSQYINAETYKKELL